MRAAWVFLHPSAGWDHLLLWNVNKIDVGFVNIRVPRGEKWQLLFIEVWAGWRSQQELAKHLGIATVGSHCHFGGGTGEKQNYWKLKAPQMGGSHPTKSGGGKWAEPEPPPWGPGVNTPPSVSSHSLSSCCHLLFAASIQQVRDT